jgi:hypothetical protein
LGRDLVEQALSPAAARRSDGDGAHLVNADGLKRAYKFKPSDSRLLEDQALERQLGASKFLPTQPVDPDALSLSPAERRTPTFHTVDVKRPARRAQPESPQDK